MVRYHPEGGVCTYRHLGVLTDEGSPGDLERFAEQVDFIWGKTRDIWSCAELRHEHRPSDWCAGEWPQYRVPEIVEVIESSGLILRSQLRRHLLGKEMQAMG